MRNSVSYVGLDYHDESVQACVLDERGGIVLNRRCANNWTAIHRVVPDAGGSIRAAIESCNGAANLAEELVMWAGWSVDLAHPGYVQRMKQNPDKTDYSDARMLADLERVGYLPRVWLAPEPVRELRRVVRYRQQLVKEQRNVKLRVGALLREQRIKPPVRVSRWGRAWLDWLRRCEQLSEQSRWIVGCHLRRLAQLQKERKAVEDRLARLTRRDTLVERLLGLKGIGLVTACVLRAEIGRFDRFRSGKQLSRFCGLSPCNASSGTRQADAGLIDACNKDLRGIVIEAAHRLIRWDQRWGKLAARLRDAGKAGSLAAASVANRWIRWLYHRMQEDMVHAV